MFMVSNITSKRSGRAVANQFKITMDTVIGRVILFQSYNTPIAMRVHSKDLDMTYYITTSKNHSRTTSKYQNMFYKEYGEGLAQQYSVPNFAEWVEVLNNRFLFNAFLLQEREKQGASTKCIEK